MCSSHTPKRTVEPKAKTKFKNAFSDFDYENDSIRSKEINKNYERYIINQY